MGLLGNLFGVLSKAAPKSGFREGDLLVSKRDDDFSTCKVLRVEENMTGYHILLFKRSPYEPRLSDIPKLEVLAFHAPVKALSGKCIGNIPVAKTELIGFYDYLKHTDFARFASETGQAVEDLIRQSCSAFEEGNALKDGGHASEAVEAYSKALDYFPLYLEALDNRAFAWMDLGQWDNAIADFHESERLHGTTLITAFSIGECHFKSQRYEQAKKHFEQSLRIDPQHEASHRFLHFAIERLRSN